LFFRSSSLFFAGLSHSNSSHHKNGNITEQFFVFFIRGKSLSNFQEQRKSQQQQGKSLF